VGAGLANSLALERNGRLTVIGYIINALILASCAASLAYPLLSHAGAVHLDCIFRELTGLPCPSCGYSRAVSCAMEKDLAASFLHNPGWIIWIGFQLWLIFIGLKSLISGHQALIGRSSLLIFMILILLIWTGKFLIGPEYY
jgi:hypothetical protein